MRTLTVDLMVNQKFKEFKKAPIQISDLEKFYNMLMTYTPEGGGKRADANSSVVKVESQFAVSCLVL